MGIYIEKFRKQQKVGVVSCTMCAFPHNVDEWVERREHDRGTYWRCERIYILGTTAKFQ